MAIAVARRAWRDFQRDDCAFLAGAVAYQIFFALLPFLLLLTGIFGFFLTERGVRREVEAILRDTFPAADPRVIDQLAAGRGASVGVGVLGSLWGVTAIHAALDRALQGVFGRVERSAFLPDKLAALAFAGLLFLLALASFAFSFVLQLLPDLFGPALAVLSPAFGFAAGFALFALIYRAVPRRRQPLRSLLLGAAVAAVLWEAGKAAFALYSRGIGAFAAYGALAFAAGLLTWIYLSALIALVGAEVIKAHARVAAG